MKRKITENLLAWKKSSFRKPLIIYGARQIGKTYTILDFGKKEYENVVYCNFENDKNLQMIFKKDLKSSNSFLSKFLFITTFFL